MKVKSKDIIQCGDKYFRVVAVIMFTLYVRPCVDVNSIPIPWKELEKDGYKIQKFLEKDEVK